MSETHPEKTSLLLRDQIYLELRKLAVNSLPGTRMPSENAIAGKFKVARMTVSRAFRKLEAENLIERRKGSGSFVKGVRTVTYLLPTADCLTRLGANAAIHRQLMQGLMRGAARLQLRFETLIPCRENNRFKYNSNLLKTFNSGSMVILTYWFCGMFHLLYEKRIRTALIWNHENLRGFRQYTADWFILEAQRRSAVQRILHLLYERSCRKIAVIDLYPEEKHHPITEIYRDFVQNKAIKPIIIPLIKHSDLHPCQWRDMLRDHLAAVYAKERFDALLLNVNNMFFGKNIHEYCNLPESVQIFGVNVQPEQLLLETPFPYCHAPYEQMGEEAVELLALSGRQNICRKYDYIFENTDQLKY
ncbi:MAG: GntR family transcriptional regulator [Lentisphaerae bacterium]|nr:GntR family transcriptional regulator [Lentisphaerota bacterium]